MAQIKVFYEPEAELLTLFWQPPRREQICTELEDGVLLIKDAITGEPIGVEILSYHPGDNRLDAVSVELGQTSPARWSVVRGGCERGCFPSLYEKGKPYPLSPGGGRRPSPTPPRTRGWSVKQLG